MKFLKLIQSEQEAIKKPYDVLYYDESKGGVFFVSNKVTITFKDWDNSQTMEPLQIFRVCKGFILFCQHSPCSIIKIH